MYTKSLVISLFFLVFFFPSLLLAGAVEKCIDSTGKITYTDKGCKNKETAEDAYLFGNMNDNNKTRGGAVQPSTVSYKVSEIGILTEQAHNQCLEKANKYFTDSFPEVTAKPEAEFPSVVDRSIKGAEVEIILSGIIRYQGDKGQHELNVQCMATKSRKNENWMLVFKDVKKPQKAVKKADNE